MEHIDTIVAGAGVVGIAVARALALAGHEVLVLEAAETIGTGISSRNSEVIHAGIYYPKDSLMARLCVAGRRKLYAFCAEHGVPHRKTGKLIVATNSEEDGKLASILAHAEANDVEGMRALSRQEATALEPALFCTSALFSPETGIVDSHAYMLALQGEAEAAGAIFAFHAPVEGGSVRGGRIELQVGGAEAMRLSCTHFVNAAGLGATALARALDGMPGELTPRTYYVRGSYFTLAGRAPFSRLIYPVPIPGGLGVHLTVDMGMQAKFGPDAEWIETPDYTVDPARGDSFTTAIRRYWPGLPDGALQPGYAGIRPKLTPQGAPSADFVVQTPREHGVPGLINLFGIESPGLTSAIALADLVAGVVG
jgi:L-2-hydroxyglutarate oxidase LhgO